MRPLPVRPLLCSAVLLLGIGTSRGLAVEHTTTDGAGQPGKKDQPAKPGKPAKPEKTAKPVLKKIKFQAAGLPWKDVFQWLAKETGKPIISYYKPTGSFTVQVPEGAAYTLPETIDLVNEALIDQKYILIQKQRSFTLVPADEKIDPALVPQIDVKDLDKRGETEIVRVNVPLRGLVAEDMQEQVKRMMGKFSEVVAIPAANELVLTDTVGSIKRVLNTIHKIESDQGGLAETYSHVCEYISAREAERILKELLGEPAKQQQQFPQQFGPGGQRFQQQPPQPVTPPKKIHRISCDEAKNMVLVTGPADIIAKARDIVKKMDVPHRGQQKVLVGPVRLKTYDVPAGKADPIAKVLQEYFKNSTSVRISTAGNSTILVLAGPEDQFKTIKLIKESVEGGTETKSFGLNTLDVAKAVELLKAMFGDSKDNKAGAPTIEGLPERNAVVVHGSPDQVKQVGNAISVIDGGNVVGGDTGRMRVITLNQGSASAMADLLERMLKQMRSNPVRVISPTRELPKNAPLMPREEEKKEEEKPKRKTALPSPRLDLVIHEDGPGLIDPQKEAKKEEPKKPVLPGKADKPLTITAFGNRLILTSDDKEALGVASELVRLFLKTPADAADFEVIRLKNASASEAAKVLDEAFNGRPEPTQAVAPFINRFGGFGAAAPVKPRPDRIRVVADPSINALIIRAAPLDLVSVHRLIEKAIDSGVTDSKAVVKTWHLGPLHNASAREVANLLGEIYKDQMRVKEVPTGTVGGYRGFDFRNFQGRNADGSPRRVSLAVGVDERTNSLLLACSETTYKEIEKLVGQMEEAAGKAKSTIRVVSADGIDPVLLQQAIDAIQGRGRTGVRSQGPGVRQESSPPSLAPPSGGPPDRRRSAGDDPRGPRFFEQRVKDDPQPSPFIDPQLSEVKTSHDSTPPLLNLRPGEAKADAGNHIKLVAHEAQAQPPGPGPGEVVAPRREVNVEGFNDLGIMVIRTDNPEDAAAVLQIIKLIREKASGAEIQIRLVELKEADCISVVTNLNLMFQRVQVGPGGFGNTLFTPRTATQGTFLGQTTSAQLQASSVVLIPLPRFNAILLATAKARMKQIIREIERLDRKNSKKTQLVSFRLKKASAARVATLVNTFWAYRYPESNQIRVTYEDSTNQVFVQAAPADLAEIQQLIWNIDNTFSKATNDIRIVFLKRALADQLAALLLRAINDGVITSTNPAGLTPLTGGVAGGVAGRGGIIGALGAGGGIGGGGLIGAGGGGFGGGAGGFAGAGGFGGAAGAAGAAGARGGAGTTLTQGPGGAGAAGGTAIGGGGITTKTTSVRFIMPGGPTAESGNLEDIHITPDIRANLLIIAAPPKTMELLLLLIDNLDVPPAVRAEINVFTLRKADATFTANLLTQLFGGVSTGVGGIQAAGGVAGGAPGGAAGAGGAGFPLQTTTSYPFLVPLRITVDTRTNSLVVAGAVPDLLRVEAIINQLEATDVPTRQNQVYKLRNSTAVDVANALQTFITNSLAIYETNLQFSYLQEIQRQVVVVPEPITNKLLISANEPYFGEVMRLIHELDAEMPMVVIQTLFVEVDLSGSEEFGIEFGLQTPVLFNRSIDANGVTVNGSGAIGTTRTLGQTVFNFNNPSVPLGNSSLIGPNLIGVQGVTNLGTGRVSPNSGIGGFVFSAQSDVFNLLIRALKTQGRIDVLSRPQVMTLDNQFARVLVGQDYPYILGTNLTATGISQQNVNYRSIGIELQVTPRISPEGRVLMRVVPTVSSVSPTPQALGNGTLAPVFNVQTVETTVGVEDGETVALGGLISTKNALSENKVPWFGDLPGVGAIFRYRQQIKSKTELMIILTPHIVRNRHDADRIMATEARRMDWIVGDVIRAHGTTGFEPLLPPPPGSIDQLTLPPPPPVTPKTPIYPNLLPGPTRLISPPPPPALPPMFPGVPGPGMMPGDTLPPPRPLGAATSASGVVQPTGGLELPTPEPPLPPAPVGTEVKLPKSKEGK